MKAMILAAGLGTRLKPLTNHKPKALIEINGKPLLEWLILRLKKYSFNEIIINTHHFAEQIHSFLKKNNNFDLHIEISHENVLLNTGGGIKNASWFFNDNKPFLVHNVDVLTDTDYLKAFDYHVKGNALVTLFTRKRKTSRYFLFNEKNNLNGWESMKSKELRIVNTDYEKLNRFSFMGIHIISPQIFSYIEDEGIFSIIDTYLKLAGEHKIKAFSADNYRWIDLGTKVYLSEAEIEFTDILR